MTIEILVRPKGNGYRAMVKGYADCTADAPTREEAIAQARNEAEDWITQAERIYVEVDESHRLPNDGVGILVDDPFFDEFVAEMKAYREEVDALQPVS
jgi:hypothetical protein